MSDMTVGGLSDRLEDKGNNRPEYTAPAVQPVAQASGGNNAGVVLDTGAAAPAYKLDITQKSNWHDPEIRNLKRTGKVDCQTCKTRQYQDESSDPGVSFKAPGHIAPESAAAVVSSHEQEHVSNERANARSENKRVLSQSVRLFTSVCPECGRVYVSGGETTTTTVTEPDKKEQKQPEKAQSLAGATK